MSESRRSRSVSKLYQGLCAVLLYAICAVAAANTLPPEASAPDGVTLKQQGEGRMRWFGLLLYDASLWSAGPKWGWDRPFALDIRYARRFAGARLAETSADEMRRLGLGDEARLRDWQARMARAFPDVAKGDRITGLYLPDRGAEFFHNGRRTEAIADPEFARSFFAIWLDPKTREPKLRAALLGER